MAKIIFFLGAAVERWDPLSALQTGIGGSETAAIHLSIELTCLGHQVKVYADVPPDTEPFVVVPPDMMGYREVGWLPYNKMPAGEKCDVFISSRRPEARQQQLPDCRQAWLWMHDLHCGPDWENVIGEHHDKILCLSKWARERFLNYYPAVDPVKVVQTANGIDDRLFSRIAHTRAYLHEEGEYFYPLCAGDQHLPFECAGGFRNRPLRVTYSSSPDRGLARLLDFWPKIHEKYGSDSSLHVYYGFDTWRKLAALRDARSELDQIALLEYRLANTAGVVFHGRAGQEEVARSYLQSQLWLYPTDFHETSCITAMEAQAAGCKIVATRCGALPETAPYAYFVDGPSRAPDYEARFLATVDAAMGDDSVMCLTPRSWAEVAEQWDGWVGEIKS